MSKNAGSAIFSGVEWLKTTAATAYDLVTSRPAYDPAAGSNAKKLPRQIVCLTAGDAVVSDVNGNATTITMTAGQALDIQVATRGVASTAELLVIW